MLFQQSLPQTISALFAASLVVTSSWASPLRKRSLDRRQNAPFVVTGLAGEAIQPRLEIRDLQQNADQWNIYLLGLQRMQAADQNDILSWFQISGIHGRPMVAWDGVNGNDNAQGAGYCTHVSNLFLSWHRPYIALYEQTVVANARDAANQFPPGPDRDRYTTAAQNLRVPYWDWAKPVPAGQHAIPDSMTTPVVTVTTPSGIQTIDNPLYTYKFHPVDQGLYYSPYTTWPQTYRHPASQAATTQNLDPDLVQQVDSNQASLADRLFKLYSNYPNYMNASNEALANGRGQGFDSFESVHDQIHVIVGGQNYGDMAVIDVSAFDPAFWLHHTSIDRHFALWQALYPGSYVEPQAQDQGSYWYNQGDVLDANTPLKPFYSDGSGNFHTSASVRDQTIFGYTYPELTSGNPADVRAAINSLYGGSSSPSTSTAPVKSAKVPGILPRGYDPLNVTGPTTNSREYIANIQADKNGQEGSYFIHMFLGEFTSDPKGWATDPNLVGTHGIFSKSSSAPAAPVPVTGTLPLSRRLQKDYADGKLTDLTDAVIQSYLKDNLHWKVQKMDGTEMSPGAIPDLKVSVVSSEVQPAASQYDLPRWIGGFTQHLEVTAGKLLGLCPEDSDFF